MSAIIYIKSGSQSNLVKSLCSGQSTYHPRIDPVQLLNCLNVLLSSSGGIKSTEEVQRLANLMSKFSKKLVSKCIYVQILKCTETGLLGLFMGSGGWRLVHIWLTESIVARNWPLVRELLELLLLCPVDIERLKTNNCPKLVKELSKDESNIDISALASKLVEQWLKTVKGENVVPIRITDITEIVTDAKSKINCETTIKPEINLNEENKSTSVSIVPEEVVKSEKSSSNDNENCTNVKEDVKESEAVPVFKISVKDGKQIISQVEETPKTVEDADKEKLKDKHKSKEKGSSKSSSSLKHSSKSKSHSSSDKHKNSSHKSSSSSSSSRHSSSKDRSKDKDRHSSSSSKSKSDSSSKKSDKSSTSSSSSNSKSKDDKKQSSEKEKSKDKNKDEKSKDDKIKDEKSKDKSTNEKSEDKLHSPSIHKLGKIPKLSDIKKEKSISIEVRKADGPKPKTVKTFHSKFRSHGLEEEVKPPPSRAALLHKKVPAALPPTIPIPKRPSPVHNEPPPEKKPKTTEPVEKPGSIKLIPPKPKPMLLLESDMFMDALNASATNKKEPKKRKRRTSGSKDGNSANDGSPPHTPTSSTSPSNEKSVPPRFYQDTLDTDDNKQKSGRDDESVDIKKEETQESMDTSEPHTLTVNGLKGVLCYHKRKGPKKSIKWRPDSELEEVQYFELDETERVNVTKTFTDMKHLERINERDAFQKARNIPNDDVMEEKTSWRPLIPVDTEGQIQVEYGKSSKEKEIQATRQKGTLQLLYYPKYITPDSPLEADPETHTYSEPTIIPLEDVTGNQDNISDFRNMPWPEPKGNAPPTTSNLNMPSMFPPNMNQFPNGFPGAQFPGFQAPNMVPAEWQNNVPPLMPNGIPGPMPPAGIAPGAMPPGNLPPGMMVTPDNIMMNPEMFVPNPMFPVGPDGFNMQQNMFPMDFTMTGPPGGPDSFQGPGNFRGAMRGRGGGGHWRGKANGNWEGPQRGRGSARGNRKAVCIYFQRKGSCRQGDNCSFLHPGVNCPF